MYRTYHFDLNQYLEAVSFAQTECALDTVREAMAACGVQEEIIKIVFDKTAQLMNDPAWEVDLRNRMKKAS